MHVLRHHIEDHQPVLELEGESRIPSFAGDHFGHIFLGRQLFRDLGVTGDASAGEQPLEPALTDQILACLVKQSADSLVARQGVHADFSAIEGHAARVMGIECAFPGDYRPVCGLGVIVPVDNQRAG